MMMSLNVQLAHSQPAPLVHGVNLRQGAETPAASMPNDAAALPSSTALESPSAPTDSFSMTESSKEPASTDESSAIASSPSGMEGSEDSAEESTATAPPQKQSKPFYQRGWFKPTVVAALASALGLIPLTKASSKGLWDGGAWKAAGAIVSATVATVGTLFVTGAMKKERAQAAEKPAEPMAVDEKPESNTAPGSPSTDASVNA